MRLILLHGCTLLALALGVQCIFWPRMVPYYYPLPYASSGASSSGRYPSGVQTGNSYAYDWNTYNQNYPQTSVLYPSSEPSYIVPPDNAGGLTSGGGGGLMSGLLQKPWLGWKFSKLGLQSPGSSCAPPRRPFSFPSLSSFFRMPSSAPCYPSSSTVCCTTTDTSRPNYIQTSVNQGIRPSSSYTSSSSSSYYNPQTSSSSGYSSQSPSSYTPSASEQTFDFVSS